MIRPEATLAQRHYLRAWLLDYSAARVALPTDPWLYRWLTGQDWSDE